MAKWRNRQAVPTVTTIKIYLIPTHLSRGDDISLTLRHILRPPGSQNHWLVRRVAIFGNVGRLCGWIQEFAVASNRADRREYAILSTMPGAVQARSGVLLFS